MKTSNTNCLILNESNTQDGDLPEIDWNMKREIERVEIRQSSKLRSIPENAFYGFTSLQSVYFENNNGAATTDRTTADRTTTARTTTAKNKTTTITSIGHSAFHGCKSLKSIIIPQGITAIRGWAFRGCTSLEMVVLPNSIISIGHLAFGECAALQSIEIPESIVNIAWNAFVGCKTLQQRQVDGVNYHPDMRIWLLQRFEKLQIHRACYHANATKSSLDLLCTLIQQNKKALVAQDAMGMTPLHILCCNPNATVEMIRVVVEAESSVVTQVDVTQSTPFHLFLKCRNFRKRGQDTTTISLLCHLFETGIKGEDLDILLVLDSHGEIDLSRQDGRTSLLPFMSAATLSTCGLDSVYTMAINTDFGTLS